MPVISRKMTANGETHKRFLERNERKEINMALKLKTASEAAPKKTANAKSTTEDKGLVGTRENPAKPADRDGDKYGATLGLKLNPTFQEMLIRNEDPKKGHKSDDELREWLLNEFPNRNNKGILYNIREIRWRYNFGKLTAIDGKPQPPELQSVRYVDGKPYEKKTTGKTGMTPEEQAMRLEERQSAERERRLNEDEKITKAKERFETFEKKVIERRAAWEKRNGELPEKAEKKSAPEKKPLKKAK